jgi:dCTP diphosphatase
LDDQTTIADLRTLVDRFVSEREWQPFHSPKNLSGSIAIEAAELMELFQWMTPDESAEIASTPSTRQHICDELADVIIYCLSLANALDIDLSQAIRGKMARNQEKYPIETRRGRL